jgi:hypothetical protein
VFLCDIQSGVNMAKCGQCISAPSLILSENGMQTAEEKGLTSAKGVLAYFTSNRFAGLGALKIEDCTQ